jgi:hypothetical protein
MKFVPEVTLALMLCDPVGLKTHLGKVFNPDLRRNEECQQNSEGEISF